MEAAVAEQIITGGLLSDVSIFRYRRGLRMNLAQGGSEHVDWVRSMTVACLSMGIGAHYRRYDSARYPKGYIYMWTRNHPLLRQLYKEWYPFGEKRVPWGLTLTPVGLANWFMGDGCSSRRSDPRYVLVKFSTHAFDEEGTSLLVGLLEELGIKAKNLRTGGGYHSIFVWEGKSVNTLMDLISPYVMPSYEYKIKRVREAI